MSELDFEDALARILQSGSADYLKNVVETVNSKISELQEKEEFAKEADYIKQLSSETKERKWVLLPDYYARHFPPSEAIIFTLSTETTLYSYERDDPTEESINYGVIADQHGFESLDEEATIASLAESFADKFPLNNEVKDIVLNSTFNRDFVLANGQQPILINGGKVDFNTDFDDASIAYINDVDNHGYTEMSQWEGGDWDDPITMRIRVNISMSLCLIKGDSPSDTKENVIMSDQIDVESFAARYLEMNRKSLRDFLYYWMETERDLDEPYNGPIIGNDGNVYYDGKELTPTALKLFNTRFMNPETNMEIIQMPDGIMYVLRGAKGEALTPLHIISAYKEWLEVNKPTETGVYFDSIDMDANGNVVINWSNLADLKKILIYMRELVADDFLATDISRGVSVRKIQDNAVQNQILHREYVNEISNRIAERKDLVPTSDPAARAIIAKVNERLLEDGIDLRTRRQRTLAEIDAALIRFVS